ncbi:Phage Mu protein F like protein [Kingella potus]|uniref:Phage Mu protein F like protein n=1 Tax=Kingella potus TaxID=265175 RepID=A0A377R5A6_9NEIS|nr:phage minor head protein [Kingella potus]STR03414.1 Phage Mu protein F like protein [Kingella potus]
MAEQIRFNTLIDRAAFDFLKSKKLLPGFSHYDVWLYEHAVAFTVAKMMDKDMLAETKAAVEVAIANGTGWHTFQKQLKPYLMARGWWGESVMLDPVDGAAKTVRLGSTRRLRTIFHTNFHTAHAAGRWVRVQAAKEELPYLKYLPSVAGERREAHKRYYNLILPVEHELWKQIFPPNGYGCLCGVIQLSEKQALRERREDIGKNPAAFTPEQIENSKQGRLDDKPDIKMVEAVNPRTGQVVRIPADITRASPTTTATDWARCRLCSGRNTAMIGGKMIAEREAYLSGKVYFTGLNTVNLYKAPPEKKWRGWIKTRRATAAATRPKRRRNAAGARRAARALRFGKTGGKPDFLIADQDLPRASADHRFSLPKTPATSSKSASSTNISLIRRVIGQTKSNKYRSTWQKLT